PHVKARPPVLRHERQIRSLAGWSFAPTAGSLSLRVLAPTFRVLGLPFATIERTNRQLLDRFGIDAPCVHADAIRMRTRHIERFDAADGTKHMLGRVSIETVCSERVA